MSVNIMDLSWEDIERLDKDKTVLFLRFAPIEAHGRHLPTGVDIFETAHWVENSIEKLEKRFKAHTFISLPMVPLGHAVFKGFPGNIHLSQKLFYCLVRSILKAVAEWGIKHIVVISGHADPKHAIAIEQACDVLNKKHGDIAFAPMGAIFSEKVSSEVRQQEKLDTQLKTYPKDYHVGWIETSCMLDIDSEKVRDYKVQPDIVVSDREMISPKKISAKAKGFGHLGYPRLAQKELGQLLNEDMAETISHCVAHFIERKDYRLYMHHELYKIPFLRVNKWGAL